MPKVSFTCDHCGGLGSREASGYNRRKTAGLPVYCSRDCGNAARRSRPKAVPWHKARFTERAGAVQTSCEVCQRVMWLPPSKVDDYRTCGPVCRKERRLAPIRERERSCVTCGGLFTPRPWQLRQGGGRYCSQKCNKAFHDASQRPEVWAERIVTMQEKRARGEWTVRSGPDNHSWKGGKQEAVRRRIESGKSAASVRAYRAKNKDKVREFATRRANRKLGRLEYGTIPKLRKLQGDKCAICRRNIAKDYTVDHIIPLAKGGEHCAANIQLLCPSCNFRKSDRDPIKHMQSLGRLL